MGQGFFGGDNAPGSYGGKEKIIKNHKNTAKKTKKNGKQKLENSEYCARPSCQFSICTKMTNCPDPKGSYGGNASLPLMMMTGPDEAWIFNASQCDHIKAAWDPSFLPTDAGAKSVSNECRC